MKKNLFLYLFIFSLLINVFTYMYFTNKQKFEDGRITTVQQQVKVLKDSLQTQQDNMRSANYFSLANNNNAIEYYKEYEPAQIEIKVRDGIYAKNINPQGNPLVEYPPMEGKAFTISKIKVLNHRWVIVDFTNGLRWGEAIIKYFVEDDGSITFETAETTLYPFTPY